MSPYTLVVSAGDMEKLLRLAAAEDAETGSSWVEHIERTCVVAPTLPIEEFSA